MSTDLNTAAAPEPSPPCPAPDTTLPPSTYALPHNSRGDHVPPSRSHIRATVEAYLGRHAEEREALEGLLVVLDGADEPSSRTTLPGHVTCSAVIIDRDRRVLHIGHRVTGLVLAPGGHVETGDRTLLAAAVREVCEEAGIRPGDLCLTPQFLGEPIDVDVHDIEANPTKGEPSHQHFDFRFAFYLTAEQPPPLALQDEEVTGAQWLPFADVRSPTLRAKLLDAEADGLDGRPEPVNASALIHDGAGRYLLHLRDDREGIWEPWVLALLGGGRTRDDSCLEATLRRELAEEVPGLEPTELVPYAVEEATSVDGLAVPIIVYAGRWSGDAEAVELREGVLLKWCTADTLDRLRLSPGLGELIRRHAAEHPAEGPPDGACPLTGEAPPGTELHIVGVHLHLQDDHGRILLGLRHPDSAFAPDTWHFLAGHCEREAAIDCLVREAKEEAGLTIAPEDVDLVHTLHHVDSPNVRPRIALVFQARSWTGDPEVLEPDRCVEWRWWKPQDLPAEVVPYTRQAIDGILRGHRYSEQGWGER
ncbi:NUDIX domain-containing protein (plasmid) [Streptomyces sp. NBC_01456]|uniref:NUDIX domain-containing protein n=1 Tax=unclassified Streptomyces TaxID=2593676 RepID=UPI002E2EEA61|nr:MULTISPECIES: NUDIX domain-containing protein [unclassified Streptomyces]